MLQTNTNNIDETVQKNSVIFKSNFFDSPYFSGARRDTKIMFFIIRCNAAASKKGINPQKTSHF